MYKPKYCINPQLSRMAHWEHARPITQRSMDQNHPLQPRLLFNHCRQTIYKPDLMLTITGNCLDIWTISGCLGLSS